MSIQSEFKKFFFEATDSTPYPYQIELACAPELPELLDVPTGLGKTAAAILGWLFRRRHASFRSATPRRLVYCLPMRTLVEQTESAATGWLNKLNRNDAKVHVLMGGREATDWDREPERDAILIGTQDMLLSRALNRGYGMSRYRWPMHFALLNNDSLWVIDETQLMGVGLTTTAQLQGLRRAKKLGTYGIAQTLWMSATLDQSQLETVDHSSEAGSTVHCLSDADLKDAAVQQRIDSHKPLRKASVALTPETQKNYPARLASSILDSHQADSLTLVVVNRVARAQDLFRELRKFADKREQRPDLRLIHSRFRKVDRSRNQSNALDETSIPTAGRILVATQAIEAGVDLSARTLFTELAPWSSLVQRFGRCNRGGEWGRKGLPDAAVFWIDVEPGDGKPARDIAAPYEPQDLETARGHLSGLSDAGPTTLRKVQHEEPPTIVHTLRRKDLLDLWDTTPDLSGNDLDVSRYIRDTEDSDVQFFWRDWEDNEKPPSAEPDKFPGPSREELCSVSIGQARDFVKKPKSGKAWRWDPLEREWAEVPHAAIRPGMVLLLHVSSGGYGDDPDLPLGWTGDPRDRPTPHPPPAEDAEPLDAMDDERSGEPVSLTEHLCKVATAATELRKQFADGPAEIPWPAIEVAARWHDVGKSHPAFQTMLLDGFDLQEREAAQAMQWAKSRPARDADGKRLRPRYRIERDGREQERPGFRHELASALAWLAHHSGEPRADLIAFLIAAHHGKVRGSIRSLSTEKAPPKAVRPFARGVWDDDELPAVDLGNGEAVPETRLSLDLMRLGDGESGRSWIQRVLALRDDPELGPFRLALLETLVRIADWRGSE